MQRRVYLLPSILMILVLTFLVAFVVIALGVPHGVPLSRAPLRREVKP